MRPAKKPAAEPREQSEVKPADPQERSEIKSADSSAVEDAMPAPETSEVEPTEPSAVEDATPTTESAENSDSASGESESTATTAAATEEDKRTVKADKLLPDYSLNNPDTLTKYKTAAGISHKVLQEVSGTCNPPTNSSVLDLTHSFRMVGRWCQNRGAMREG